MTNKTFYTVECDADEDDIFETYEEALAAAKRKSGQYYANKYFVMKAEAFAQAPVPEAEVVTLS